ncbi:hypothetical protein [Phenylobacterium sp. SCN 70-31]|uniref:hypothetical protein n=1 Tax=Phenylobacterium sp. SCN 70-31 TaxID=1660129 RepID=UPI0008695A97|nr:hypothetical protein [Phenylobacterium sp. SCN 70-31]ODT86466.1 MAG: hypothetical protein ABS78_16065 [Phenylobacterium sp. SCN 70-31]
MSKSMIPAAADVVSDVSARAFGRPLVSNHLRSMVVETIMALSLPAGWTCCGEDWAGWDLSHDDGTRLEVKQSAARQTWPAPRRPAQPTFDIRERTGWWEGATWFRGVGRHAHIYVFAYHPVTDDTADHRDPGQWRFFVVRTEDLPSGKSLSLARLKADAQPLDLAGAVAAVEALREERARRLRPPSSPLAEGAVRLS